MGLRHLTELRDVIPVITGEFPIDALGAIKEKIQQLESQYEESLDEDGVSQGLTDLAAVTTVLTGSTPFQIYVFTLTTDFANATYTFAFVEKAPNVETATTL